MWGWRLILSQSLPGHFLKSRGHPSLFGRKRGVCRIVTGTPLRCECEGRPSFPHGEGDGRPNHSFSVPSLSLERWLLLFEGRCYVTVDTPGVFLVGTTWVTSGPSHGLEDEGGSSLLLDEGRDGLHSHLRLTFWTWRRLRWTVFSPSWGNQSGLVTVSSGRFSLKFILGLTTFYYRSKLIVWRVVLVLILLKLTLIFVIIWLWLRLYCVYNLNRLFINFLSGIYTKSLVDICMFVRFFIRVFLYLLYFISVGF